MSMATAGTSKFTNLYFDDVDDVDDPIVVSDDGIADDEARIAVPIDDARL